MSLVEIVVGLLIVVVMATGILSYYNYSHKHLAESGAKLACGELAQNVITKIKSFDNASRYTNFHPYVNPSGVLVTDPGNYAPVSNLSRSTGGMQLFTPSPGQPVTPAQTNAWLLVDSSYNWAAALYNNANFCNQPIPSTSIQGTEITSHPAFTSGAWTLNLPSNYRAYLNIKRWNATTGTMDCPAVGTLAVPPRSAANLNDYGVSVELTLARNFENNGVPTTEYCRANTILKPDAVMSSPSFIGVIGSNLDPNPGANGCGVFGIAPPPVYCTCNAPPPNDSVCIVASCSNPPCGPDGFSAAGQVPRRLCTDTTGGTSVSARIGFRSNTAANLFACGLWWQPDDNDPNTWPGYNAAQMFQCSQIPINGTAGNVSARQVAGSNANYSGLILEGTLPLGQYTFASNAFDPGRNSSPVTGINFEVVDPCPPSWTDRFCPPPALNHVDQCGNPNRCVGTMPLTCPDPAAFRCGTPLFDSCGRPCPPGTGLDLASCNPGAVPCGNYGVVDACGNGCPMPGTGCNASQANPGSTPCGQASTDSCGNACGPPGTATAVGCGTVAGNYSGLTSCDGCGNPCMFTSCDETADYVPDPSGALYEPGGLECTGIPPIVVCAGPPSPAPLPSIPAPSCSGGCPDAPGCPLAPSCGVAPSPVVKVDMNCPIASDILVNILLPWGPASVNVTGGMTDQQCTINGMTCNTKIPLEIVQGPDCNGVCRKVACSGPDTNPSPAPCSIGAWSGTSTTYCQCEKDSAGWPRNFCLTVSGNPMPSGTGVAPGCATGYGCAPGCGTTPPDPACGQLRYHVTYGWCNPFFDSRCFGPFLFP